MKKRMDIVSVQLSPEAKDQLDSVCEARGMTIKTLLGRLIVWFVGLDRTEQSIVLGQVDERDVVDLATLVLRRRTHNVADAVESAVSEARAARKGGRRQSVAESA